MSAGLLERNTGLLRFKELCIRYANLMVSEGITTTPFCADKIANFKAKPASVREQQIHALTVDILSLESMLAEGRPIRDSRTHVSRFISMMGYEVQPDLLDKIGPEDQVQIYLHIGTEQHQIFRNVQSFEMTSFSIEQLLDLDWQTAYIHKPEFRNDVFEAITHCSAAPRPATVAFHPRLHVLTENQPVNARTFSTTMKYLSPLLQDGQIKAFLSTNHARILAAAE